jgi:hypothetical protein
LLEAGLLEDAVVYFAQKQVDDSLEVTVMCCRRRALTLIAGSLFEDALDTHELFIAT